jgi:hypothetical protein
MKLCQDLDAEIVHKNNFAAFMEKELIGVIDGVMKNAS